MKNICDLHTHSVLSGHAFSSATENIAYAKSIGIRYYGLSEHQTDNVGIGVQKYVGSNMRVFPREVDGMRILRGMEFNILEKGNIELFESKTNYLDYGIASMHSYMYSKDHTFEENTEAYLNVLDNPLINIVGHIDDGNYPCDIYNIVKKAKDLGKLVELNNTSMHPDSPRKNGRENCAKLIKACIDLDMPLIINSDAHICYDIGRMDFVYPLAKELGFKDENILNFNEELFLKYFG